MGLMRKLMMGCISGVRTLVNTTDPHPSPVSMKTPITLTVGASYSVSWSGTIPSSNYHPYYLFNILGGDGVLSGMCYAMLERSYSNKKLSITLLGTSLYDTTVSVGDSITLELRFKVNAVSTSSPYYTMDVELYVNGTQAVSGTRSGELNAGAAGLHHYSNAAGTFIIKKLS